MSYPVKNGQTSVVLRFKLLDATSTVGAGKTGLTNSSSGLIISTIADNESAAVAYTQAGGTIQTIAALGTYAAPSASNCRFKEVDATNHPGVYEFQFADARFAVASAKSLLISVTGVSGVVQADFSVPLVSDDPYVAKLTAAAVATGVWQDATAGDFTAANSVGKSVMNGVSLGTGLTVAAVSGAVGSVTAGVTVTTNNDKTGYSLSQTFPTNFSALGISVGGHISNVDTLTTYTGNTPQTGDAYPRLGAPAGASVSADVAAVKTDSAAIKTQTDQLTFTAANKLDANIRMVNSVVVTGAGTTGSPWGP